MRAHATQHDEKVREHCLFSPGSAELNGGACNLQFSKRLLGANCILRAGPGLNLHCFRTSRTMPRLTSSSSGISPRSFVSLTH